MAYDSNSPEDTTVPEKIRENFRALKEDKIVAAATATKLEVAHTINDVPFDGTADIVITQISGKDIATTDEIPTSLPANGGNADTLDGKHASDFVPAGYGVPAGAVQYFVRKTAPDGWLNADGSAISRTQYADLFAAIGTICGAGDGSTTFNLPDLRGEFVRGFDDGRGVDAERTLGSTQKGSLVAYDPSITSVGVTSLINSDDNTTLMKQRAGLDNPTAISDYTGLNNAYTSGVAQSVIANPVGYGFGVTRPRNIALLACIKY